MVVAMLLLPLEGCFMDWPEELVRSDGKRPPDASVDRPIDHAVERPADRAPDTAEECTSTQQCQDGARPLCNVTTGRCVACLAATDCKDPLRPLCSSESSCVECNSSTDCKDLARPVCDAATASCVGCLQSSQCVKLELPVCDANTLECVQCLQSAQCSSVTGKPVCDANLKACVECLAATDCKTTAKPACELMSKVCVACVANTGCLSATKPVCNSATHTCVGCLQSSECTAAAGKPVCDPGTLTCVGCLQKSDCTNPSAPVCDIASRTCVGCLQKSDCAGSSNCALGTHTCVGCVDNGDCGPGTVCDTAKHACVGCLVASDCKDATMPACDPSTQTCVSCLSTANCTFDSTRPVCDTTTHLCVRCLQSLDCKTPQPPVCDPTTKSCVECLDSTNCTASGKPVCALDSKTCVQCLSSSDCTATTPVCDLVTRTCRACRVHTECDTAAGGLCTLDGACPAEGLIVYVDNSSTASPNGTRKSPYLGINGAMGSNKTYVLVRRGNKDYGDTTLDKSHDVYAEPGTVIKTTACDKVLFQSAATVVFVGFTVKGNVKIKDAGTKVTLLRNTIDGTGYNCIGVNMTGADPTMTLDRNLILSHVQGGIFADGYYTITNNYVVKNGSGAAIFGGARLDPVGTPAVFVNNTVADNVAKGSNNAEVAIRCEKPLDVVNSIVWTNTTAGSYKAQLDPDCRPLYSDVQGLTPPLTNNNISVDPSFVGGTGGATPWHITPGPCDNTADATKAPPFDYDGDARSATTPDIGADEI
jgi:hypothetical protein